MQGRVPESLGRKGQLDALRACAVSHVLYTHFWQTRSWLGSAGPFFFFVLSGYLITGILLRSREAPGGLRIFYIRRALRIMPVYYVTLGLAWLLNLQNIRSSFFWHAFYLSNVWFGLKNSWAEPWVTAHFWTLSVEEQFYLVWPMIVLFAPRRAMRPIVWTAILAGVAYQLWGVHVGAPMGWSLLLPASLDRLGLGALLAVSEAEGRFPRWLNAAGWIAFGGVVALTLVGMSDNLSYRLLLGIELLSLSFAALIAAASTGIQGAVGALLDWPPLQYVGRISYGIYLFHLFLYALVLKAWHWFQWTPPLAEGPGLFVGLMTLSILAATASWHLFETKVNSWKEHFQVFPLRPVLVLPAVASGEIMHSASVGHPDSALKLPFSGEQGGDVAGQS